MEDKKTIRIRMKEADRRLVERASNLMAIPVSTFCRMSAIQNARRKIQNQLLIREGGE